MASRHTLFWVFYWLGFTPWDGHGQVTRLLELIEGTADMSALPPGAALDWRTLRDKVGIEYRLHDLRHFFASGLIAAGCDVVTVQRALGHSSAAITLTTYSHLWPDANGPYPQGRRRAVRPVPRIYCGRTADRAGNLGC